MKSIFGVIAVLSILGNLLLCLVISRKRSMLKKPYNVLILNLAVTDMLMGRSDFVDVYHLLIRSVLCCSYIASYADHYKQNA